jgi:hypothetical protein
MFYIPHALLSLPGLIPHMVVYVSEGSLYLVVHVHISLEIKSRQSFATECN